MKIAMPVNEKSLEASVGSSFGRTNYLLFYNTVTNETEFLDNSAVASQGGAGIRVSQVVADNGARALITPQCGENAEKILRSAEILIYKAIPGTVKENIHAFKEEKLALLDDFIVKSNKDE